jgi:mannose-6-phosphate isomerase-like protein (cupin superfamily)
VSGTKAIQLFIEFENKTVNLQKNQGITVPRVVMHRPHVNEPTVVIMVESDSVTPTRD